MRLRRYSKERGAGDQTSGGRGKLLKGTSGLSRVEMVVRETLQNSWDARDEEWYPAYGVRAYQVDDGVRAALRDEVFSDLPDSLRVLETSLAAPGLHVLEIFDRGTSGLDGPFHASEVASEGQPNNFNSFVFDIGTTKDSLTAGGTYGFGKTATFEVSGAHSVVYWTRCLGDGGQLEHRLIAASLHDAYAEGGVRFTGAHWWGDPSIVDDIVPLRGAAAEELGDRLFRTGFGDEETGTSILVIDPVISLEREEDEAAGETLAVRSRELADALVTQVKAALAHSVWPKTFTQNGENPPMIIQVFRDGEDQGVEAEIRSAYSRYANGLMAIRLKSGQLADDVVFEADSDLIRSKLIPITLRPRGSERRDLYFGERTDNVVGYLHLSTNVADGAGGSLDPEHNALCMMRSEPELVVRYDPVTDFEQSILQWHGVFKPTREADHHFRAAEPPTHDSWNPESADSEISKYVVSKVLSQIRTKTRQFLSEHRPEAPTGDRSVRRIATDLRGFVPFGETPVADESAPRTRRTRRRDASPRREQITAEVVDARPMADGMGHDLTVHVTGGSAQEVELTPVIHAITADGRLALGEEDLTIVWKDDDGVAGRRRSYRMRTGEQIRLVLRTTVPAALQIDFETEVAS